MLAITEAHEIMQKWAECQGWDGWSQLNLALTHIYMKCDLEEFDYILGRVAENENEAKGQ